MPLIAQNPPIGPPILLYRPLKCAYHAALPFVPRSGADRPLVGQNLPLVSFIPQNRPFVGFSSDPSCLKKNFEKKFWEMSQTFSGRPAESQARKFFWPGKNIFLLRINLLLHIVVDLALLFQVCFNRVAFMAQRLEAVAHPLFFVHLMRKYVVNVVSWRNFSQALASSADRMLG